MDKNQVLSRLPKMNELLEHPKIQALQEDYPRETLKNALKVSLDLLRQSLLKDMAEHGSTSCSQAEYTEEVVALATNYLQHPSYSLKSVINATGVVLHTNLGRAPLPPEALEHVLDIAGGYSNLEYDMISGRRGERYQHVRESLRELTGAEDALVVNNNAAAVLLCLSALAQGKDVIISRGELVEIGGSFRIPDVLAQSGARLVEVGTTNKTHLKDYRQAVNENTALILKVHPSNYKILGFTSQVADSALKDLAREYDLILMKDLGSGAFLDFTPYAFAKEPTVKESVKAGVDLITFSGDKLLGGPQAGIILGKRELINEIKTHPLTRALRIDKLTLAALEAVLWLYKTRQWHKIPVVGMLTKTLEEMEKEALTLAEGLKLALGQRCEAVVLDDVSPVGGGSMPAHELPTKVVALKIQGISARELSYKLRRAKPPIIGRINREIFLLDLRSLQEGDVEKIIETVEKRL